MRSNVPNLDGMDPADLWAFWKHHYASGPRARNIQEIFPDRGRGTGKATVDLALYASNKATAMKLRAGGDIPGALRYECICDRIYDELPEWARW